MKLQGTVTVGSKTYETLEFGELQLWNFTNFVKCLNEGTAKEANWLAAAEFIAKYIPGLVEDGLVEYDSLTGKSNILLSVEDLQDLFGSIRDIWNKESPEIEEKVTNKRRSKASV